MESIIQLLHRVVESISQSESECRSVVSNSLWPNGPQAARLLSPWNSPGQNPRGGSLSLIQGIFPTKGLNPGLQHCRLILYCLSHQGSPIRLILILFPFYWWGNWGSEIELQNSLLTLYYHGMVHFNIFFYFTGSSFSWLKTYLLNMPTIFRKSLTRHTSYIK